MPCEFFAIITKKTARTKQLAKHSKHGREIMKGELNYIQLFTKSH